MIQFSRVFLITTMLMVTQLAPADPNANSQLNLIDSSVSDIKTELGKTLGCKWAGEGPMFACPAEPLGASVVVTVDAKGSLETLEIGALNVTRPKEIKTERRSKAYVLRLMAQLFPDWKGSTAWMKKALKEARSGDEDKVYETTVDGWKVSVSALQPADLDDTFAHVIISKH